MCIYIYTHKYVGNHAGSILEELVLSQTEKLWGLMQLELGYSRHRVCRKMVRCFAPLYLKVLLYSTELIKEFSLACSLFSFQNVKTLVALKKIFM